MRRIPSYLDDYDIFSPSKLPYISAEPSDRRGETGSSSQVDTAWIEQSLSVPDILDNIFKNALKALKNFLYNHAETPVTIPDNIWNKFETQHRVTTPLPAEKCKWKRAEEFYIYVKGKLKGNGFIGLSFIDELYEKICKLYDSVYNEELPCD